MYRKMPSSFVKTANYNFNQRKVMTHLCFVPIFKRLCTQQKVIASLTIPHQKGFGRKFKLALVRETEQVSIAIEFYQGYQKGKSHPTKTNSQD
mgnify:CR=1 FL=1